MSIENKFNDKILLTKKQLNKLKKRVLKEYYDNRRRYNMQDIKDLFSVTDVPQEIISKELSKIVKKDTYFSNQKLSKKTKQGNGLVSSIKRLMYAALISGLITGSFILALSSFEKMLAFDVCRERYDNKLIEYADTNKDGIISKKEEKGFQDNIAKTKNVVFTSVLDDIPFKRYPDYQNGYRVPPEEFTQWLEEYNLE